MSTPGEAAHQRGMMWLALTPEGHCPQCTALVYAQEPTCSECASARPEAGWPARAQHPSGLLGERVAGRYLVTRYLARGAHASVFRVWGVETPRAFAMKVIDLGAFNSNEQREILTRLRREIAVIGCVYHPHIVSLHEVLSPLEGIICLVMELIDGQTLQALVDQSGPLSAPRALALLRQIALGAHAVHALGVAHRDLKPENIMVSRMAAGHEFVHLLDFGLVTGSVTQRITNQFVGTPLYASPEACSNKPVDARSDLYALGCLLFMMLTGRPPFTSRALFDVIYSHLTRPAPTLQETLGEEVHPELEALVASLLAKRPQQRPPDVEALLTRIDALYAKLERAPRVAHHTPALAQPQRALARATVLAIEPEPARAQALLQALSARAAQVSVQPSALDALRWCAHHTPDVIVVADELGDMSLEEAARLLQRLCQGAPLLVRSPGGTARLDAPHTDTLATPADDDALADALTRLLQAAP